MPRYRQQVKIRGAVVRRIREANALTQAEFAERMGVTSRTVIKWEQWGAIFDALPFIRNSKLHRLERLAKAAGKPLTAKKFTPAKKRLTEKPCKPRSQPRRTRSTPKIPP
jgi:transcriptional regulator with XRE-family HTH domain